MTSLIITCLSFRLTIRWCYMYVERLKNMYNIYILYPYVHTLFDIKPLNTIFEYIHIIYK